MSRIISFKFDVEDFLCFYRYKKRLLQNVRLKTLGVVIISKEKQFFPIFIAKNVSGVVVLLFFFCLDEAFLFNVWGICLDSELQYPVFPC